MNPLPPSMPFSNILPLLLICWCYSSDVSVASPVISSTTNCDECRTQQLDTNVTITFTLPQEVHAIVLACHCKCVLFNTFILLSFQNLPRDPAAYNDSLSCVYWEFAKSVVAATRNIDPLPIVRVLISFCVQCRVEEEDPPTGSWSRSGCHMTSREGQVVVCECNHLTHFAILLSPGVEVCT